MDAVLVFLILGYVIVAMGFCGMLLVRFWWGKLPRGERHCEVLSRIAQSNDEECDIWFDVDSNDADSRAA